MAAIDSLDFNYTHPGTRTTIPNTNARIRTKRTQPISGHYEPAVIWGPPPNPEPFYCTRCLQSLKSIKGHCPRCGSAHSTIGPIPTVLNSEGPAPRRDHPLPPRSVQTPHRRTKRSHSRRRSAGPNRRRKRAIV